MTTIASLLGARANDPHTGLVFEDQRWTYADYVQCCAERAAMLAALRRPGPFHVGVLLENVPEFVMWLGAAALARATIVGINPTMRGAELERAVRHTECQLALTSSAGGYRDLLAGLDLGIAPDRLFDVDSAEYGLALKPHIGAALPAEPANDRDILAIIFTSGTSGRPKAVLYSQSRLAMPGPWIVDAFKLTAADVVYVPMPLFHSMALNAGWVPALASGAALALRRRFSASAFLDDVRRYQVTYFNYVGKPLAYILATPERADDADSPLRVAFGSEAGPHAEPFGRRFACTVFDSYGQSEGGASVWRTPDTPAGSLGPAPEGVVVLNSENDEECPPARFDDFGHLLNAEEAIGEMVNKNGLSDFEGYWRNEEATAARVRGGYYWTGDLAYRDERGFLYFAGRDYDWLRVDGENFAAVPVENILCRHPDVVLAAVFPVPAVDSGDDVMCVLEMRPGTTFDPAEFAAFLALQSDLGTKWAPRFVRIATSTPLTETTKVLKRQLRKEHWTTSDPVWWRPSKGSGYVPLSEEDREELHAKIAARGQLL